MEKRISLDELEQCLAILIRKAKAEGQEEIETGESDFYWNIETDEWTNFKQEPKTTVGSLDDDIVELKRLIKEPSRASIVDWERLAAVFRLLSSDSQIR